MKAPKSILCRTVDFKKLFNFAPLSYRDWDLPILERALTILENGFPAKPSVHVVARILQACRKLGNQHCSLRLHAYVLQSGMEMHAYLGNHLVSVLIEVGCLAPAQKLFNKLTHRYSSTWNALISGSLECGMLKYALDLYHRMQKDVTQLSVVNFTGLLKACIRLQDLENGIQLHRHAVRQGLLGKNAFLGTAVVDMYAKCGSILQAQEVFEGLPVKGLVAWTTLIGGHIKCGYPKQALKCYDQMLHANLTPDVVTFTCGLKACSILGDLDKGLEIHTEMARRGFLTSDAFVVSSLVHMYSSCGLLMQAQEVFDKLKANDIVSWTAMIAGYTAIGDCNKALECYDQMQFKGISPNPVTYACTLKACISSGDLEKATRIHEEVKKRGLANTDQLVGSMLVDMYAKFGSFSMAWDALNTLQCRNVVAWNALISGYVMHGHNHEALACHYQMIKCDDISPDDVTLVCCLKACASLGAVEEGQKLHAEIARKELCTIEHVGHVLVDMYAKCGFIVRAQEVLEELPYEDDVLWNSLISGQVKHGYYEEALCCLEQMQVHGIPPDGISYACGLKACSGLGSLEMGEHIHAEVSKQGLLNKDTVIDNTLVDMYAKCGSLSKAHAVFDKLHYRDIITWTSLIAGCAQLGDQDDVIYIFDRMREEGIEPNSITFINVLNVCSHAGTVDMGEAYLNVMVKEYDMLPTIEHYTCIVDILSRAGQVEKAFSIIKQVPFHPDFVIWLTVLGACQQGGIKDFGREAFKHALPLDGQDPVAYVFMSNICADYRLENSF
ncbi:hypothetical protein KP509_24G028500 [Ceratopteris richardii]|uniref:Pentatricopeptide repeat-containing protein n=1 Tax=Ceratopteris richardii TaxID=49495 RepID=A0A8T2RWH1_CERRI|nr:hypothetical protein KP509_24G028500 [Ceratopteris richardii]